MAKFRHFTDKERAEIEGRIQDVFAFVQDVLDEPAVLDQLPEKATLELTPLAQQDAAQAYAVETRRFAVSVDPSDKDRRTHSA